MPHNIKVLHVEQEVSGSERTAIESVVASDLHREYLLQQERRLRTMVEGLSELAQSEDTMDTRLAESEKELEEIYAQLNAIDAYSAEGRAASILTGLQVLSSLKNLGLYTRTGVIGNATNADEELIGRLADAGCTGVCTLRKP